MATCSATERDALMGASNVAAAYSTWAGKVPPLSMQVLTYMALVSKDSDRQPWFGQGHAALAVHALGRPEPATKADIAAVERAVAPLAKAGAIRVDRRASVRRDGPSTVRYRLVLWPVDVPRNPGDVTAEDIDESIVDNPAQDPQRPTESGTHVPRNPGRRPTESGATSHGNRGTEEYEEYEEQPEEEMADLRTAVTVPRARCDHGVPDTIRCPACTRGLGTKQRHLKAV
jgi:hypothetical protein